MLEKLWCPENNRVLVCVDSYCNGVLSGHFYNFYQEAEEFESLSQLLIRVETMLDEQRTPQSYTTPRTFASIMDQLGDTELPAASRKGERATFELKILFRQHASWQGTVTWLEHRETSHFRSALELLGLMDSALAKQEAPDVIPLRMEG